MDSFFYPILMKPIAFVLLFLVCGSAYSQLGFCNGSKGNPIFFENFGSGTNFGPPLPAGATSYSYTPYIPDDGQYTLHYNNTNNNTWHQSADHTFDESPDGLNGKALIINASFTPGEFYRRVVTGLCVNTNFEFSAWLMNIYKASSNVCGGIGIPIDVTFEIWDASETTLLKTGSTGPIVGTNTPIWTQYGLTFATLPGQTSVVLKIKNNGAGGCGNDLAIDDIAFRSCGDYAMINTPAVTGSRYDACSSNLPLSLPLSLSITNLTPHVFQWQESTDTSVWNNIAGENAITYTASNLMQTKFFRVIIAQDAANLANPYCYTISETFSVVVNQQPAPPISNGNVLGCSDSNTVLGVTAGPGQSVDWFDAASGGNLVAANTASLQIATSGTYYAEAFLPNMACRSANRTPVTLTVSQTPQVGDAEFILCKDQVLVLDAGIPGMDYLWSTGETTQTIQVAVAGVYTVTVTNPDGCAATKTVTVTQDSTGIVVEIAIDGTTVTIHSNSLFLEYSIDGIHYQDSNVFADLDGGKHTLYIRKNNGCTNEILLQEIIILSVPKFFTPNGDGINDMLEVAELALLPNAQMAIFDRFGKLLQNLTAAHPIWDGTFEGKKLPASDYWYKVSYDSGPIRKGHFTLKR